MPPHAGAGKENLGAPYPRSPHAPVRLPKPFDLRPLARALAPATGRAAGDFLPGA